jgi:hypothetical protein
LITLCLELININFLYFWILHLSAVHILIESAPYFQLDVWILIEMKWRRWFIAWVNSRSAYKICIYGNRSLIQSIFGLLWMQLKQINLIVVPVNSYLTQACLRIHWTQTMLISALTQSQKSNIMDQIDEKDFIFQINLNIFYTYSYVILFPSYAYFYAYFTSFFLIYF